MTVQRHLYWKCLEPTCTCQTTALLDISLAVMRRNGDKRRSGGRNESNLAILVE